MKRILSAIFFALLMTAMCASVAPGQVIVVQDYPKFIATGGSYVILTRTTTPVPYNSDSTSAADYIPIKYTGTAFPALLGQYPDSIALFSYGTADTAHDVEIRFKAAARYGTKTSNFTSVLVDSNRSTSAAETFKRVTISALSYSMYDVLGISCLTRVQVDAYNAYIKANASKVYLRLERYFHR